MMPVSELVATSVSIMKHPPRTTENFEFNLGKSPDLRCLASKGTTICTKCESCVVRSRFMETRQWFLRAGEKTKRCFLLGLVRRFQSANLFAYVLQILKPLCGKDYLYSRSRANPGLDGDHIDAGHNRALQNQATEETIQDTLRWFSVASYWSKSNYILGVLQMCSGELVHAINKLAQTMLNNEKQKQIIRNQNVDYENESLVDTEFSFQSHKHPETNLLRAASSIYSQPINPFGEGDYLELDHVLVEDESEDTISDLSATSSVHSLDPTLCIMSAAYSALSGVQQHMDFIRCLPVHLSKYILSFMEYGDLVSCFDVSPHWCYVAKEVEEDMKMRQIIWEEVMLMQGSSAKGGNPVFANHLDVPVPRLAGDSYDVLLSDDPPEEVNFKSDISLVTSYSGLVTYDVRMEERNIYCGAYNVMVLSDQQDINRVVHYNFGQLVAIGSFDRHVRFLDVISGQETGPLITGHAGSIKSLYINEARGFVISGSFDTSIRCWDIASGRPMKHFHGHMGTILCLDMYEDTLVSGSKDNQVKVWNFESGKCKRTFKHQDQINTVAVHRDTVVSGCEEGKVKVWSIKQACLLKVLYRSPKHLNRFGLPNPNTHQGPIASVKLDDWHVVSGSMDGYALVWSALGNHNKCVKALRHPKAVLCVHMAYLRLVTGCEDGKLRIWNMLTGDCLRVLRGNSRSDPIVAIHPCGERLLLQTITNLLMLCFEEVEWNYRQKEKIELLCYKNHYGDAPLRQQSYSLVRAQRGQLAGAVNQKIISHSAPQRDSGNVVLTHSSRSLSDKSMQKARKRQEVCVNVTLTQNAKGPLYHNIQGPRQVDMDDRTDLGLIEVRGQTSTYRVNSRPPTGRSKSSFTASPGQGSSFLGSRPSSGATQSVKMSRSDAAELFSRQSRGSSPAFSKVSFPDAGIQKESGSRHPTTAMSSSSAHMKSTKFRLPQRGHSAPVGRGKSPSDAVSLSEAKALLRSQQRITKEGVTRDCLLLTLGNMEQGKKDSDVVNNTIANALQIDYVGYAALSTAYSIPSTLSSYNSSTISRVPVKKTAYPKSPKLPIAKEIVVKTIEHTKQDLKLQKSIHPKTVESTVPRANMVRPQTVQVVHRSEINVPVMRDTGGVKTSLRRCKSETAVMSTSVAASQAHFEVSHIVSPVHKKKSHGWTTSHTEPVTIVPMLMRQQGSGTTSNGESSSASGGGVTQGMGSRTEKPSTTGRLSMIQKPVKDPLTSHGEFQVRTRKQTQDYLKYVSGIQEKYFQEQDEEERRMQRKMWLQMAKGRRSSSVPSKKSASSK